MGMSWPDTVFCLGITALICGTLLGIAWVNRNKP